MCVALQIPIENFISPFLEKKCENRIGHGFDIMIVMFVFIMDTFMC